MAASASKPVLTLLLVARRCNSTTAKVSLARPQVFDVSRGRTAFFSTDTPPPPSSAPSSTSPTQSSGGLSQPQPQRVFSLREIKGLGLQAKQPTQSDAQPTDSFDRNFITTVRAMQEYLLKPDQIVGLRVTTRRSPNENMPKLHVYWRKDIEAKAVEAWGSLENLQKEKEKRLLQEAQKEELSSFFRRYLADRRHRKLESLRRESWPVRPLTMDTRGLEGRSGKVVVAAIAINALNCAGKFVAWIYTGSHAMFSEMIHSVADTCNQMILAYGIQKSIKQPSEEHPYGYTNMQYVVSLISGVGIFCMGSGLSVYHGITGLLQPEPVGSFTIAFVVLTGSFISEGVTLALAVRSIRESAAAQQMGFFEFVLGGYDPCVNVVLLEDAAAVMGVMIAAGAMGASTMLNSHIPDALGSLTIGCLLGAVASFMIYTNTTALVGRSIPEEKLVLINRVLEGDIMVRQVHDVKGIDMGTGIIRYKAEVDVDGRELAKYYLSKSNLPGLLGEVKAITTEQELELFLLKHGENIVDCLGEQVDRIERKLKSLHPEIKFVDLEVL